MNPYWTKATYFFPFFLVWRYYSSTYFLSLFLVVFSVSGLSPFMGDNDNETLSNVTSATWDFEDEAFDEISDEAKDFISNLLKKDMKWVHISASLSPKSLFRKYMKVYICCLIWWVILNVWFTWFPLSCIMHLCTLRFSSLSETVHFLFHNIFFLSADQCLCFFVFRARLTCDQCFQHPWLKQDTTIMEAKKLSKERMKKYILRRKWQVRI